MPKLEPKQIQKELEDGWIWPVYWIYGQERMKSRELLKRIRRIAVGEGGPFGMNEEKIDGSLATGFSIVEAAQSLTLGGGLRFIVVTEAQDLKEAEKIEMLFGPRAKKGDLPFVCVFLSRDLDQRKKISKLLTEKAVVVACDEVPEADRPAWIEYLAKQRNIKIDPASVNQLALLEPWSLDIIDQELEKLSLSGDESGAVLLMGGAHTHASERFLEGLLSRNSKEALTSVEGFATEPEQAIPLLGLLGWNLRQLALFSAGPSAGRPKPNPYLAEKLRRWAPHWNLTEIERLQEAVSEVDFLSKQTSAHPLGSWADLAIRFCDER